MPEEITINFLIAGEDSSENEKLAELIKEFFQIHQIPYKISFVCKNLAKILRFLQDDFVNILFLDFSPPQKQDAVELIAEVFPVVDLFLVSSKDVGSQNVQVEFPNIHFIERPNQAQKETFFGILFDLVKDF